MEQLPHQKETRRRQLAYTDEFKRLVKEHPGAIESFLQLFESLKNVGEKKSDGNIDVELFAETPFSRLTGKKFPFYKVTLGDNVFFVKTGGAGFSEFNDSAKAAETLKDIPWVEVIPFQLGFSDKNGDDFFVSKWINLPTVQQVQASGDEVKMKHLQERLSELKRRLGRGYFDVNERNAFYDETRDKIVLYDLNDVSKWLKN